MRGGIFYNGTVDGYYLASKSGVRPSINMKPNIKIVNGDGTAQNPYILEGDKTKPSSGARLNTRTSGEYITFGNGGKYRIVNVEDGKTKVVSWEPLRDKKDSNKFLTKSFDTNNNNVLYTPTSPTNIGYYLNNDYLNPSNGYITSSELNMIEQNQAWYLGTINNGQNYGRGKCITPGINCVKNATSVRATVGMLRVGELFSGQFATYIVPSYAYSYNYTADYWLINPRTSDLNVLDRESRLFMYGSNSYIIGVRPSMYLKSTIKITGGSGTKQDPYTIGF